jgi:hypothetical protein
MTSIAKGTDFAHWLIAIVVLLAIMAAIPSPYNEWLAGLIVLGALYADVKINGGQSLLDSLYSK